MFSPMLVFSTILKGVSKQTKVIDIEFSNSRPKLKEDWKDHEFTI